MRHPRGQISSPSVTGRFCRRYTFTGKKNWQCAQKYQAPSNLSKVPKALLVPTLAMLKLLVGHLVNASSNSKDDDIILSWLDLHAIGIAYAEPALRYLGYFVTPFADSV